MNDSTYLSSVVMPMFRKIYPSVIPVEHKIVSPTNLGIISESNLLKKIQKIGCRNHKPTEILVKFNGEQLIKHAFTVGSEYPTKEKAQEALVEFLYDYSMKGNIVGCSTIKRFHTSSLKLIFAPTNDYSYSNINAEVIDSIIQSVDWK